VGEEEQFTFRAGSWVSFFPIDVSRFLFSAHRGSANGKYKKLLVMQRYLDHVTRPRPHGLRRLAL
jgi:hypothetical protein